MSRWNYVRLLRTGMGQRAKLKQLLKQHNILILLSELLFLT